MANVSAFPNGVTSLAGGNSASFSSDTLVMSTPLVRPGFLTIDSTAGTTITANIKGSLDGVTFFNVPYATVAAPATAAVAALTITTTTVTGVHLLEFAYLYLRVDFSANTGVTINSVKVLV